MTPTNLAILLGQLMENGTIAFYNPVRNDKTAVRTKVWCGDLDSANNAQKRVTDDCLESYFDDLNSNNYSILFGDGSLAQIEYCFRDAAIIRHRYNFIPAPFDLPGGLNPDEVFDAVTTLDVGTSDVRLRSRLRFDMLEKGDEKHPRSHLTLLNQECRIAARHGFGVRSFLRFIYRNFPPCPNADDALKLLANDFVSGLGPDDVWKAEPHLMWA